MKVTFSLLMRLAKNTLATNCTEPSAASSDCAANANDIKLQMLPVMKHVKPILNGRKDVT